MRNTMGSFESKNSKQSTELEEPFTNPFDERSHSKKDKACFLSLWFLSNVTTFMLGYYIKEHWFMNTTSNVCDGSL